MLENSKINQKRLRIAHHETGHAVIALYFGQAIQKVSLKEIDSPNGTDKYLGHVQLVPIDSKKIVTINKAMQDVMISLSGFAGEILFYDDVPGIPMDDLDRAMRITENLLKNKEFKEIVEKMPIPELEIMPKVTDSLMRAFIDSQLRCCIELLSQVQPIIDVLAKELLNKEELTGDEFNSLFQSEIRKNKRYNAT
jgi:ATP-dependent Zn protease